jgi:MFS family permease
MSAAFASSATIDRHRAITLAALMATYMEAVNISLPNAALPHIQGALSMADDEVGWVFTAYIAAGATVMPVARWLAGRYGRKTIYQLSLAVFSLGVILDTLATSPIQFVFARIVQGPRAARSPRCRWRSCLICCRRRAMPGSASCGRCASCSASAAARASAAGSANIRAGTRFSISACR